MVNPVSRREFLNLLATTGGTAAALRAGTALNLLPAASAASWICLISAVTSAKSPYLVAVFQGLLRPMN